MTSTPSHHDDASPPPSRELDDLITRHLDGGLDAIEMRRLATLLEASPAARETLARYLRLEGAIIRLASAGLLGPGAGGEAGTPPGPLARDGSSRWLRPAALAIAGSTLAVVIAGLFLSQHESGPVGGGDVAFIADRWLELQAGHAAAEREQDDPETQEDVADEPAAMAGSPPRWLVAAMADEAVGQSGPDEG